MLQRALQTGAVAASLLFFSGPAHAQLDSIALRGTVSRGDRFEPIPEVLVSLAGTGIYARTDSGGTFRFSRIEPGSYRVNLARAGYYSRNFVITVPRTVTEEIDVGLIELEATGEPPVTLVGRVLNETSEQPVGRAVVDLNGSTVTLSNDAGVFTIDTIHPGVNHLEIRRVGYYPISANISVPDTQPALVPFLLTPLPLRLADVEVVAEGGRTVYAGGRMSDFYRRMRSTSGTFITREDIERRNPTYLIDLMYQVPGARVEFVNGIRRVSVRGIAGRRCENATIVLDGMRIRGEFNLDQLPIEWVNAIEVHRGAAIPLELTDMSGCGVIVIWTR